MKLLDKVAIIAKFVTQKYNAVGKKGASGLSRGNSTANHDLVFLSHCICSRDWPVPQRTEDIVNRKSQLKSY